MLNVANSAEHEKIDANRQPTMIPDAASEWTTYPKHVTRVRPSEQTSPPRSLIQRLGSLCRFQKDDWGYVTARRTLDIAGSLFVLAVTIPLMLLIALLIKLDSPGPVLFKHVRTGINRRKLGTEQYTGPERRTKELFGRQFILYKFRSMHADARDRFPELYVYDYSPEELMSLPIKILVGKKCDPCAFMGMVEGLSPAVDDPRVTRIGKWLRKTSLDELPNFLNVLKGDMHLVGPRPDMVENIRYYLKAHLRKLEVKPGVTGLPQIMGRGKLSFVQINEYDVAYVNTRSLLLDLKILLKTVVVAIKREGAY